MEPEGDPPVAFVEFDSDSLDVWQDWRVTLEPRLSASDGRSLEGRDVEWTSSDDDVATVSDVGLVEGVAEGTAEITASSEGVRGGVQVRVREPPEVEVHSVEPDTARAGETLTIRGQGFVEEGLRVRVAGLAAEVLHRSREEVQVRVPAICTAESAPPVEVSTLLGGRSHQVAHPARSTEPMAMEVGDFRRLGDPADFCLHFGPTAEDEAYLVGVQSVSDVPGSLTPVTVQGATEEVETKVAGDPGEVDGAPVRPAEGSGGSPRPRGRTAGASGSLGHAGEAPVGPRSEFLEGHLRTEARIRQEDRAMAQRLAGRAPAALESPEMARELGAQGVLAPPVEEGDTLEIRIPDLDGNNLCDQYQDVEVVAQKVGERAVWLEDVDNPTGSMSEADFTALSRDFDEDIYPAVTDHFGPPPDFDGNGRIAVVLSQVLNEFEASVLGFVTSADFNTRGDCASSNFGEYFYARAPEAEGSYGSLQQARMDLRRLAAHELTHIIQFGRRVERRIGTFQEVWELEGQAVLAEEVAGYRSLGREARSNLGLVEALGRDKDPETGVRWHIQGTNDLFRYFGLAGDQEEWVRVEGAPEECTWLDRDVAGLHGAPCEMRRRDPYGVAWSFLRWTADYLHGDLSQGEAEFHKGLIDSGTVGFASMEDVTGHSREALLARWAASLYADGRLPDGVGEEVSFPSWDLKDIDDALAEDETLPPEARLVPRVRGFTDFEDPVSVRGGSSAYFVVEGEERSRTFVRATGQEDPLLPAHMQLWIVRLR